MNNGPAVAKTVWTEADFDTMDSLRRRAPIFSDGPWLFVEERGGFSFARESYG